MNTPAAATPALLQKLDDLLPQTQCTQCGYAGCRPYAQAMTEGLAKPNRCAPGGPSTIDSLSALLNVPVEPLDPECGQQVDRRIAHIQAEHCIGCTLCIKACPVDAIIGSNKNRHAVIAALCTGCELCIPPCPVDCIDMQVIPEHSQWTPNMAHEARARLHQRDARRKRQDEENRLRLESKAIAKLKTLESTTPSDEDLKKRAIIEAALKRARDRRQGSTQ